MSAMPSPDDIRMLVLLSQGASIALVARRLRISRASVNRRLQQLRRDHEARNNIHLAAIAVRRGWLEGGVQPWPQRLKL